MRVVHVHRIRGIGGSERHLLTLLPALRERGVDARGIDISSFAIDAAPAAMRPFCRQGSIAEPLDERFDLIV